MVINLPRSLSAQVEAQLKKQEEEEYKGEHDDVTAVVSSMDQYEHITAPVRNSTPSEVQ